MHPPCCVAPIHPFRALIDQPWQNNACHGAAASVRGTDVPDVTGIIPFVGSAISVEPVAQGIYGGGSIARSNRHSPKGPAAAVQVCPGITGFRSRSRDRDLRADLPAGESSQPRCGESRGERTTARAGRAPDFQDPEQKQVFSLLRHRSVGPSIGLCSFDNLFGTRLSPMSQVRSVTYVSGLDRGYMVAGERFIRSPPSISAFSPSAAPLAEATRRLRATPTTTLASAGSLLALEYTSMERSERSTSARDTLLASRHSLAVAV